MSTPDTSTPTAAILGANLDSTMVLVGDSEGLSAIYEVNTSSVMPGMLAVETEHGVLYLDPESEYNVLDLP